MAHKQVKYRVMGGESLLNVFRELSERTKPVLSLVRTVEPYRIGTTELSGLMPEIIDELNRTEFQLNPISIDSIQVNSANADFLASFYSRGQDLRTLFELETLLLQDFYQWGFGKKNHRMPKFVAPAKEDEIEVSKDDKGVINFFRACGWRYNIGMTVPVFNGNQLVDYKPISYQRDISMGGIILIKEVSDPNTDVRILVSFPNAGSLIRNAYSEYFHFLLGNITRKHMTNDKKYKPGSMMVDEYLRLRQEWSTREEGIVHGAQFLWERSLNKKYNLGIPEELFQSDERKLVSQGEVPVYGYVPQIKRKIQELGLARVVDIYRDNPQELFP